MVKPFTQKPAGAAQTGPAQTFQRLLEWLDDGLDSEGQKYLEMRRRLVAYFERKNCPRADELADETLNRVARRLAEEGTIAGDGPARYCYITARFVFMEHLRAREKESSIQGELQRRNSVPGPIQEDEAAVVREQRLRCLDRCMKNLDIHNRDLILSYYAGKRRTKIENRRGLAKALGITINALAIRACRIRDQLERCVKECARAK